MTSKTIYQPFTYCITFILTGQRYYGSRYANNKTTVAHPDQLWTTYFTSSKVIKSLIKEHGKESFTFQDIIQNSNNFIDILNHSVDIYCYIRYCTLYYIHTAVVTGYVLLPVLDNTHSNTLEWERKLEVEYTLVEDNNKVVNKVLT